jgi:nitronate monooxygenase
MGITEELWSQTKKMDFGSELDAAKAEAQAWKTIWSAGQGVTAIDDIRSTADLITDLKREFKVALESQQQNYKTYC